MSVLRVRWRNNAWFAGGVAVYELATLFRNATAQVFSITNSLTNPPNSRDSSIVVVPYQTSPYDWPTANAAVQHRIFSSPTAQSNVSAGVSEAQPSRAKTRPYGGVRRAGAETPKPQSAECCPGLSHRPTGGGRWQTNRRV